MNVGILANVEDRFVPGFVPKISIPNLFFSLDDAHAKNVDDSLVTDQLLHWCMTHSLSGISTGDE